VTKVLLINGANYAWDTCAPILHATLEAAADLSVILTDDRGVLASSAVSEYDVIIVGSGFTRRVVGADGVSTFVPEFTDAQSAGLLSAVRTGAGFIGLHATGWAIGGQHVLLLGGSANMHPPRSEEPFEVTIADPTHAVAEGLAAFHVPDEIYLTARDARVRRGPGVLHLARSRPEHVREPDDAAHAAQRRVLGRPALTGRPAAATSRSRGLGPPSDGGLPPLWNRHGEAPGQSRTSARLMVAALASLGRW
jgi:hypothetical protein